MKKVYLIDNYDSFTYNLLHYFEAAGVEVIVVKNDQITAASILQGGATHCVLSPGPGTPNGAGNTLAIIDQLHQTLPLLGVCLGHQAIAQYFGAAIVPAAEVMHGKCSIITHSATGLFQDCPSPYRVARYHSWSVLENSLPTCLKVTARTQAVDHESQRGTIMGLAHTSLPVFGVQFHPEAILSEHGHRLLQNFLNIH